MLGGNISFSPKILGGFMYFLGDIKVFNNVKKYGIVDTKDGAIEYYPKEDLDSIVTKVTIEGLNQMNNTYINLRDILDEYDLSKLKEKVSRKLYSSLCRDGSNYNSLFYLCLLGDKVLTCNPISHREYKFNETKDMIIILLKDSNGTNFILSLNSDGLYSVYSFTGANFASTYPVGGGHLFKLHYKTNLDLDDERLYVHIISDKGANFVKIINRGYGGIELTMK